MFGVIDEHLTLEHNAEYLSRIELGVKIWEGKGGEESVFPLMRIVWKMKGEGVEELLDIVLPFTIL